MPPPKKAHIVSYKIEEEVLVPAGAISIEFKGKNPFRIYHRLGGILQTIFHGRGKNIFERSFKWDITGDPIDFFVETWFDDSRFDRFTNYRVRVRVHGQQPSDPENPNGVCKIEIKPFLETTYRFGNAFERMIGIGFIWLYHRLMYNNVRRRYIQIIKEWVHSLEVAIREEYGIPLEKPELTGASSRVP